MLQDILEVFTKEHKVKATYIELKRKMRPKILLKNRSESVDKKMERLDERSYVSHCSVKVGDFR